MMPYVGFLARTIDDEEDDDSVGIFMEITEISSSIYQYIRSRVPTFKPTFSRALGYTYYANNCNKCDALYGDNFRNQEFYPTDEAEASSMYITKLPFEPPITIDAGISYGLGDMILDNAKETT
jgi:hypothetical protein